MNNRYFVQLAIQSINKHRQTYFPYMLAVSAFVAMFYLLLFLRDNIQTTQEINSTAFHYLLTLAVFVFGAFVVVFLVYSNSYLIRPRTKEFGLLYLLGLSQRHLLIIIFYEITILYAISTVFGLFTGVILSRLMSMVLSALTKLPLLVHQLIDYRDIAITAGLFVGVMCVVLIINVMQIVGAKPIAMMQKHQQSKSALWRQYALLLYGIVSIGYAYWAILSIDSPQRAYELMASIIFMIISGTYCLFMSLSVTMLRILAQRPEFYFRTNNFISISGLLNRIRQNAISLASVSVFAFLILTMVSMTGVIYLGASESVEKMYAADIIITINEQNIQSKTQLRERVYDTIVTQGVQSNFTENYTFISLSTIQSGSSFMYERNNRTLVGDAQSHFMALLTMNEYNRLYDETLQLAPNEVAVYSSYMPLPDTFELEGNTYRVVKLLPYLSIANYDLVQLVNAHFIVVHDYSVLKLHEINRLLQNSEQQSPIRYRFGINLSGDSAQKLKVYLALQQLLATDDTLTSVQQYPDSYSRGVNIQSRQAEKLIFEAIYGTLLFLGLFLGVLFIMSTALLIYYKQLSEGYEDKTRFEILQRIGMTREEVRESVDKQIVSLFFIPLLVASVHFVMSLHLIEHLLMLFRIENIQLLMLVAAVTILVFSAIYLVIYRVSARVYYNIVR